MAAHVPLPPVSSAARIILPAIQDTALCILRSVRNEELVPIEMKNWCPFA
jgi:hypothetical protein